MGKQTVNMKKPINEYNINERKAQSTLEYSMTMIILLTSVLLMSFYIVRALNGRARDAVDGIGEQYSPKTAFSNTVQKMSNPTPMNTTATPSWRTYNGYTYEVTVTNTTGSTNVTIEPGSSEQIGEFQFE